MVETCQGATELQRLLLRAHLAFESCGGLLAAVEIGSAEAYSSLLAVRIFNSWR